jgi:hypothetical protein
MRARRRTKDLRALAIAAHLAARVPHACAGAVEYSGAPPPRSIGSTIKCALVANGDAPAQILAMPLHDTVERNDWGAAEHALCVLPSNRRISDTGHAGRPLMRRGCNGPLSLLADAHGVCAFRPRCHAAHSVSTRRAFPHGPACIAGSLRRPSARSQAACRIPRLRSLPRRITDDVLSPPRQRAHADWLLACRRRNRQDSSALAPEQPAAMDPPPRIPRNTRSDQRSRALGGKLGLAINSSQTSLGMVSGKSRTSAPLSRSNVDPSQPPV